MVTVVKQLAGPAASAPPAPDGVESLENIALEVEQEGRAAAAAAAPAQQAQQQNQAKSDQEQIDAVVAQVTGMLIGVRDLAADLTYEAGVLPKDKLVEIWSDETIGKLATPLLVVSAQAGGHLAEFLEKHGPYLALIGATVLPAIATFKAVRAHRAIPVSAREVPPGG